MSPTRLLWAVALVLAVVVVGMSYLNRTDEPTIDVVVAKQRIPAGVMVTPSMYVLTSVPSDTVVPGAIADPTYLRLQRVAHPISPGELLLASDLLPRSTALQRPHAKA